MREALRPYETSQYVMVHEQDEPSGSRSAPSLTAASAPRGKTLDDVTESARACSYYSS